MNIKKLLILLLLSAISIAAYAAPAWNSSGNSTSSRRPSAQQVANYQSALSALITSLVQNNPKSASAILNAAMGADPSMAALISGAAAQGMAQAVASGAPGAAAAQRALASFNTNNAGVIANTRANISPNISTANAENALTSDLNNVGFATALSATGGQSTGFSENPATTNIGQQMVTNIQTALQSGQITQAQANQLQVLLHAVNPSISISPSTP